MWDQALQAQVGLKDLAQRFYPPHPILWVCCLFQGLYDPWKMFQGRNALFQFDEPMLMMLFRVHHFLVTQYFQLACRDRLRPINPCNPRDYQHPSS